VVGSDLVRDIGCTDKGFSWFSEVPTGKFRDSISNRPRPLPSTAFTIFLSSYHLTLHNLGTGNFVKWPRTLGSIPGRRKRFFRSATASRPTLGPTRFLSNGYRGSFTGIKRPGRESHYLSPSSSEFKNTWSFISAPTFVLMAWCLIGHEHNLTQIV
jgi:hypothetical protein